MAYDVRTIITDDNGLILIGSNFSSWYRNLRNFLNDGNIVYVLDSEIPPLPHFDRTKEEFDANVKHRIDDVQASCLMLASMSAELRKLFHENMHAFGMIQHLKELFDGPSRAAKRYETSKELCRCKMEEGSSLTEHLVKIIGYIEKLDKLGFGMDNALKVDLVLQSLPPIYSNFIMNYNKNMMETTLSELLNMLRIEESYLKKGVDESFVSKTNWHKSSSKEGSQIETQKGKIVKPTGNIIKPNGKPYRQGIKKKKTGQNKKWSKIKPSKLKCYNCRERGHFAKDCNMLPRRSNGLHHQGLRNLC